MSAAAHGTKRERKRERKAGPLIENLRTHKMTLVTRFSFQVLILAMDIQANLNHFLDLAR